MESFPLNDSIIPQDVSSLLHSHLTFLLLNLKLLLLLESKFWKFKKYFSCLVFVSENIPKMSVNIITLYYWH